MHSVAICIDGSKSVVSKTAGSLVGIQAGTHIYTSPCQFSLPLAHICDEAVFLFVCLLKPTNFVNSPSLSTHKFLNIQYF